MTIGDGGPSARECAIGVCAAQDNLGPDFVTALPCGSLRHGTRPIAIETTVGPTPSPQEFKMLPRARRC
jgi:hypothetical protein